jgi:hypothetical protein
LYKKNLLGRGLIKIEKHCSSEHLGSQEVLKRRKRQEGKFEEYMGVNVMGEMKDALFWRWRGRITFS